MYLQDPKFRSISDRQVHVI